MSCLLHKCLIGLAGAHGADLLTGLGAALVLVLSVFLLLVGTEFLKNY